MIIVQVGTNMGSWEVYENGQAGPVINDNGQIHFDSCLKFVKENKDNIEFLHLIEPLVECNPYIEKSYNFFDNKKIYNVAITDNYTQSTMTIHRPKNSKTNGHSSYNINHLIYYKHNEIESVEVPCFTLNKFFEVNNIEKCDKLFVDTEGLDCLLLYDYDHNKYQTNYIEFEVAHSDGPNRTSINAERYIKKLTADGFKVEKDNFDNLNLVAIR